MVNGKLHTATIHFVNLLSKEFLAVYQLFFFAVQSIRITNKVTLSHCAKYFMDFFFIILIYLHSFSYDHQKSYFIYKICFKKQNFHMCLFCLVNQMLVYDSHSHSGASSDQLRLNMQTLVEVPLRS